MTGTSPTPEPRIVPREPTDEMIEAGQANEVGFWSVDTGQMDAALSEEEVRDIWRAMWDASPAPVESGDVKSGYWLDEVLRRNGPCPTCGTLGMLGSIEDAALTKPMESDAAREAVEAAIKGRLRHIDGPYNSAFDNGVNAARVAAMQAFAALSLRPEGEEGRLRIERDALLAECDEQDQTITRLTEVLNRARRALLRGSDQIEAAVEIDALALASRPIPAEMPDVAGFLRRWLSDYERRREVLNTHPDLYAAFIDEAATALERMSK